MIYTQFVVKENIVKVLFAILTILIVCYSLTLLSLTGNAITVKKLSIQIKKTETDIARAERDYSNSISSLNASHFSSFGFAMATNSTFAVKKDEIATFSVLYERR